MENHQLGLRRWRLGGLQTVQQHRLAQVVFEADQPVLRPIRDAIDSVVQVFLLDFVLGHQDIALAFQFFDHMAKAADVKSKHT